LYRRAAGTSEFQERASVTKFTGNPMAREMTWGIGDRIPTRDTRKFEYEVGIVNVFGTELARMSVPGTVPP
jgi:hypothetical protein